MHRRDVLRQAVWAAGAYWLANTGRLQARLRGPEVRVVPVQGEPVQGVVERLTAEGVGLTGKSTQFFPWAQLVRVEWVGQPAANVLEHPLVLFPNGDLLGLQVVEFLEEKVRAKWSRYPAWPELDVPLELLRGAILRPSSAPTTRLQQFVRVESQTAKSDTLWLTNDDQLSGELEAPEQGQWKLASANGPVLISQDRVRAVAFNPDLGNFPVLSNTASLLQLTDGSRLTGKILGWLPPGLLQFETAWKIPLTISQEQISAVHLRGPRCEWLSSREPMSYRQTPFIGREWAWSRDRNVLGGCLACGRRQYVHGIGLHGQSELTFALGKQAQFFQTEVGLDEMATQPGSVECVVLVDGREVFRSPVIRQGRAPIVIGPLSVRGAQSLTLRVDRADFGDVQDHVTWGEPVLLRSE